MVFGRKRANPIDRAVEDLDRQIIALQRQLRQLSVDAPNNGGDSPAEKSSAPPPSLATAAVKFLKGLLTPPDRNSITPSNRARQDLFDVSAEPLKDLEAEPIALQQTPEPNLFSRSEGSASWPAESSRLAQGKDPAVAEKKLMHYLSAGSIKTYKPLKHVQRQVRNRFFKWLALSLVALWLLYAVIR